MVNKSNSPQTTRSSAINYLLSHRKILLALIIIQAVAYMYLFTGITFTNHTFPNVLLYPYPSFKTQGEGRWMADILIQLGGGSGNQSIQMSIAVILQAVNGVLLAKWLNLKRQLHIFLIAALLCIFPAFLDYYGFAVDHISFVVGDSLCIAGAYLLRRGTLMSTFGSSILYSLSLAIYGPKIALVSFTAISSFILRATEDSPCTPPNKTREILKEILLPVLSVLSAMIMYWLSYKLFAVYTLGLRTHTNNIAEAISELSRSYLNTIQYFSGDIGGLPSKIRFLPLILVVAGASRAVAIALHTRGIIGALLVGMSVLLGPATINATWIVNREAWLTPGRLYTAYAYFFLFYLSFLLRWKSSQKITELATGLMLFLFFTLASQQVNALELKTVYETSFVNRITQRVEPFLSKTTATGERSALVVLGDIPTFDVSQYVHFPPRLGTSHALTTATFVSYRQIEILNFFLGWQGVRKPSLSEQKAVIDESRNVQPWPSQQSTFRASQAIGVVLDKYRPGSSVTWHDKQ